MVMTPGSRGTGLVRQPHDVRDLHLATALPAATAPPSAYSLERFITHGIEDQGSTSMCQTYAVHKMREIQACEQGLPPLLGSKAYNYEPAKERDATIDGTHQWTGDTGATLRSALASIAQDGVCPVIGFHQPVGWPDGEALIDINPLRWWRQQATPGSKPPYRLGIYDILSDPTELGHHHKGWLYMAVDQSVQAVKTAIAHNHAVVFGIEAKESIYGVGPDGIMTVPAAAEMHYGYHALCVVGYDDALSNGTYTGFFTVVNSWSVAWGKAGTGLMPYAWWQPAPGVITPFDAWALRFTR